MKRPAADLTDTSLSPSDRLERLAHALTALADDVLLTVREIREQEQADDDPPKS